MIPGRCWLKFQLDLTVGTDKRFCVSVGGGSLQSSYKHCLEYPISRAPCQCLYQLLWSVVSERRCCTLMCTVHAGRVLHSDISLCHIVYIAHPRRHIARRCQRCQVLPANWLQLWRDVWTPCSWTGSYLSDSEGFMQNSTKCKLYIVHCVSKHSAILISAIYLDSVDQC